MGKPETTNLRREIVAEWNKCGETMSEIALRFGMTRSAIARNLWEARKLNWFVIAVDTQTRAQRSNAARRANLGEDGYREYLVQQAALMRRALADKRQRAMAA